MNNFNIDNCYYISDLHFNHHWTNKDGETRGVILFERTQFSTIKEHDDYLMNMLYSWAEKHNGDNLFILGDFGNPDFLFVIEELRYHYGVNCYFIWGNHDLDKYYDRFCEVFNDVYKNPVYISSRVLLSHEPRYPMATGEINIHGHLHASKLDSSQHICVSAHVVDYKIIQPKTIHKVLSKFEKPSFKFLKEPYADKYIFTQPKEDAIYDKKTGKIDLPASIKLHNEKMKNK